MSHGAEEGSFQDPEPRSAAEKGDDQLDGGPGHGIIGGGRVVLTPTPTPMGPFAVGSDPQGAVIPIMEFTS